MMEPEAWPSGEMSELERRLLEAARADRMPRELSARMAQGLGVQASASPSMAPAAASHAAGVAGTPLFAKVGLWGVLSIALVAAVAGWRAAYSKATEREAAVPPTLASAPSQVARAASVPAVAEAAPSDAALQAEIALLDQARNALREGASARALQLLDRHQRRFAPARLAPEAAALRIEALLQRGASAEATALAARFVSAYPNHPLSAQVGKLTAPQPSPAGATP